MCPHTQGFAINNEVPFLFPGSAPSSSREKAPYKTMKKSQKYCSLFAFS